MDSINPELSKNLDRFELCQLEEVVKICRQSKNLSQAGRTLFSISRKDKKNKNDADRLRKYLSKFDLTWEAVES